MLLDKLNTHLLQLVSDAGQAFTLLDLTTAISPTQQGIWLGKLNITVPETIESIVAASHKAYANLNYNYAWSFNDQTTQIDLSELSGAVGLTWERHYELTAVSSRITQPLAIAEANEKVVPEKYYILSGSAIPLTYLGRPEEKQTGATGELELTITDTSKHTGYAMVYPCQAETTVFIDSTEANKDADYQKLNVMVTRLMADTYQNIQTDTTVNTHKVLMELQEPVMRLTSVEQAKQTDWRFIAKLRLVGKLLIEIQDTSPEAAGTIKAIATSLVD